MKFLLLVLMAFVGASVEAKTFYLVRHAEKADDGSKNPVLTEQGQIRATNLAKMLSAAEISKVYATDYQRTQLTARPMADLLGVVVTSYDPRQLAEFAETLKQLEGNALVVGHSNTTPELAALLAGQPVTSMGESDFAEIYQVVLLGDEVEVNMLRSTPVDLEFMDKNLSQK